MYPMILSSRLEDIILFYSNYFYFCYLRIGYLTFLGFWCECGLGGGVWGFFYLDWTWISGWLRVWGWGWTWDLDIRLVHFLYGWKLSYYELFLKDKTEEDTTGDEDEDDDGDEIDFKDFSIILFTFFWENNKPPAVYYFNDPSFSDSF